MKAKLGELIVDETTGTVSHGAERLSVSRKAVELLVHLGHSAGRTVERRALLRALWPDREVSDKALSMLVVEVRRALARLLPGVETIRTHQGVGYALCIPYEFSTALPVFACGVSRTHGRMSIAIQAPTLLTSSARAREFAACWHDTLTNSLAGERALSVRAYEAVATSAAMDTLSLIVQSSVRLIQRDLLLSVRCVTPGDERVCWAASERASSSQAFEAELRLSNRLKHELGLAATGCCGRQMWREYRQSAGFSALTDGQRLVATRSGEGISAARGEFQRALALDPGCAPALVGMADCEMMSTFYDGAEQTGATHRASSFVERALALDPELSSAHSTRGFIDLLQLRFASAERELLEAIRLDDSNAMALQWYADFLASQGRMEDATQAGFLAVTRAPDSVLVNSQLGQLLHMAGRFEEADAQLLHALSMDPASAGTHCFLALNLAMQGDATALEHARRAVELSPGTPFYRGAFGSILARFGKRERALQQLHLLESNASRAQSFSEAAMMVASALGQAKRAIDLFRTSTVNGAAWALYAAAFPILTPIHADPSFKTLLRGRGMALTDS